MGLWWHRSQAGELWPSGRGNRTLGSLEPTGHRRSACRSPRAPTGRQAGGGPRWPRCLATQEQEEVRILYFKLNLLRDNVSGRKSHGQPKHTQTSNSFTVEGDVTWGLIITELFKYINIWQTRKNKWSRAWKYSHLLTINVFTASRVEGKCKTVCEMDLELKSWKTTRQSNGHDSTAQHRMRDAQWILKRNFNSRNEKCVKQTVKLLEKLGSLSAV